MNEGLSLLSLKPGTIPAAEAAEAAFRQWRHTKKHLAKSLLTYCTMYVPLKGKERKEDLQKILLAEHIMQYSLLILLLLHCYIAVMSQSSNYYENQLRNDHFHHLLSSCVKLSFFAVEFSRDENEYGYVCIMFYRKCTKLQNTTSPPLLLQQQQRTVLYHEIQISSWYTIWKRWSIFYKKFSLAMYFTFFWETSFLSF